MRRARLSPAIIALSLAGLNLAAQTPGPPLHVRSPFIETFHRGKKTLVYVAASHHSSVDYPNAMDDPVFKTIERAFVTISPDAVIVEGVDPSVKMSQFLEHAQQCAAASYNLPGQPCDEPAFAAYRASQIGADVMTGEPSAAVELAAFESHGYSIQDFFAFWIMNNIPYEKRHGPLTNQNLPKLVDRVVSWENHCLATSVRFTAEDFTSWYAKNMHIPASYLDISLEDSNPYPPAEEPQTLFHTLSALNTQARDENVVATIKTALSTHNRVLVVYGSGHVRFEWNDLIQLMDVPAESKPY